MEYSGVLFSEDRVGVLIASYPAVVSEIGANIIGFAYCGSFAPDVLELMNIFVSKTHRNRGIGTVLLRKLEEQIFHQYSGIVLVNSALYSALEGKYMATSFYVKNGYRLLMSTGNTDIFGKVK